METESETFTLQEQRFINGARGSQRFSRLWIAIAFALIATGIYLMVCHTRIFFHFDHILAGGIHEDLLKTFLAHNSRLDSGPQILIRRAYYAYLPDLFFGFGACAFSWGTTLLIHTLTTTMWLRIIGKRTK